MTRDQVGSGETLGVGNSALWRAADTALSPEGTTVRLQELAVLSLPGSRPVPAARTRPVGRSNHRRYGSTSPTRSKSGAN
ncbi:MAG: hypothetical protein QOG76_5305 [Pseudonocardiales bacterium]|nr:hypothetical protein [Pseudonocardiales bacterium]